jgi:uncharacterized protein (TIGR03663 family)
MTGARKRLGHPAAWEVGFWCALLVIAGGLRLADLGARIMTHDESIHANSSYTLFSKGEYRHDPVYHGPFLYYATASAYFLFGDSDATARLAPAMFGLLLVAAVFPFRRWIGSTGAAVGGALVAISPVMLFYSRHAREDIYVALFTVVWVYSAFRYVGDREVRWLYLLAATMALSFITKESSFIFGAIIGSFFVMSAVVLRKTGNGDASAAACGDVAVVMLTLVLPFAAGPLYIALGWDPRASAPSTAAAVKGGWLVGGLLAIAGTVAALWMRRRARALDSWRVSLIDWVALMALFWAIAGLFFTSLLANPVGGLVTGIAGSLGYWLTQHDVERGSQPWFYYFVIGALYEFLPMLLGATATIAAMLRLRDPQWDPGPDAADAEGAGRDQRRLFLVFLIWWAAGSWIGYAWAGERMPWLLVHQVLPLTLLAGWWVALVVARHRRLPPMGITAGVIAFLVLMVGLIQFGPGTGRDVTSVAATAGWWSRLVLVAALTAWLAVRLARAGRPVARASVGLAVVAVLVAWTLRASLQASFVNIDLASEPISYAQGSPDIRRLLQRIDAISERTAGVKDVVVAYDDESSWPLVWYLRRYPHARPWGTSPEFAGSAPVILSGQKNLTALMPYVAQGYVGYRYVTYWWPLQDYATETPARFVPSLLDGEFRSRLWRAFARRDFTGRPLDWPHRREIHMFVRQDLAAFGDPPAAAPEVHVGQRALEPQQVITGPFDGVSLRDPTSIAIADDGSRVIADAGNHRVLVLDVDGKLRLVIGNRRCAVEESGRPGCVDRDGAGPRTAGEGQFNEPWGVAVGPDGQYAVADTWNGRVQIFDRAGAVKRVWGRFGRETSGEPGNAALRLFGPRGLVFDTEGTLLVADTGNKRLWQGDPDGSAPARFILGAFDEPTAIARDSNGTFVVADAWNRRVLRLDRRGAILASWPVPGWLSRSAEHKPGIAVDLAGLTYASDPESGRVLVFAPSGSVLRMLRVPPTDDGPARPTGLAVDEPRRQLLVLDHRGGRLLVFALESGAPKVGIGAASPERP